MIDTRGAFDIRRQFLITAAASMNQLEGIKSAWTRVWLLMTVVVVGARAGAATTSIDFDATLGAIPESICNAATFLQGPVGFAIVALIFAIGVIRLLAGNRGGMGFIITAFVVGLVLMAAPDILAVFTEDGCDAPAGG